MSCAIERMSWSEIIDTYSLFISENDVYIFLSREGTEQVQNELMDLLEEFHQNPSSNMKIKRFLEENSRSFDKLKYVMMVNFNCKMEMKDIMKKAYRDLTQTEREIMEVHNETLIGIREALKNKIDKSIAIIVKSNEEERKKRVFIVTLNFLADRENEFSKKKMQQKSLLLKSDVEISDLLYQAPEKVFDRMDMDEIVKATAEFTAVINSTSDDKVINDAIFRRTLQEKGDEYVKHLSSIVEDNIDFIDIEGMIIGAIITNLDAIENQELTKEEQEKIIERLEKVMLLANKILKKGIAENPENIVQFNELKQMYKKRILDGQFITQNNLQLVIEGLMTEKYNLRQLSDSILELIGEVTPEIWLKNKENFIFAIRNNYAKDKSIYDIIVEIRQCNTNVIIYTLMNNMMSKDDVIDLYMQKVITLEQVRNIEQNLGEQLISLEDIMQKYKDDYETVHEKAKAQSLDEREKEEQESNSDGISTNKRSRKKSFEELATQAIALKEEGLENEKVEEALIEMDSEEIETAMMIFYTNYLIDAKTVFESCGEQMIQFLRPVDIRNLYNEGSITIENLKKAVRGMDEEKAIHFICKTFHGNETELQTLIDAINIDIVENEEREESEVIDRKSVKKNGLVSNEQRYIGLSAIVHKYRFYEALDPDYANTYYRNGFEVFELPNVKYENTEEPWIIIEPMIDKSHKSDRVKAAQDKAMWILPKSLWERHKERIVGSDYTIKTGMLRWLYDSVESKQMTKMHHIISNQEKIREKEINVEHGKLPRHGWPFRIIRKAKLERQYTEEEEKELLKLGLQLEKSMVRE